MFKATDCLLVWGIYLFLAATEVTAQPSPRQSWIGAAVHHDVSPPVLLLPPKRFHFTRKRPEYRVKPVPRPLRHPGVDLARQFAFLAGNAMPTPFSFEGAGQGFTGPDGAFEVSSAPPDTVGDIGPQHYMQVVNTGLAIFDRQGRALYGPVATNTLWSGFGGGCEQNNDGDGIVLYDLLADRWFVTQFSVSSQPYLQCVAVSTTNNPLGSYYRYAFEYEDFPDYGKFGVWPDGYYATFNMFRNFEFQGGLVCAYERRNMLKGAPARQQCRLAGAEIGGLLPSDLDGPRLPPLDSPNYIATFDYSNGSVLQLWKFHVDWRNPGNTSLERLDDINVSPIFIPCEGNGGACVAQPGTATMLSIIADRLMFRMPYRNHGTHESLLMNHTVNAAPAGSGIRWYEVQRSLRGELSSFQHATYAPDGNFRWMGSLAMDQAGNIALGYSHSSSLSHPSIRIAGRLYSDAPGSLPQGEDILASGGGSQTDGVDRWGDYSMMSVDPVDDCTFWFTGEYLKDSGSFNWSSRVGTFKYPNCPIQRANDFSLSVSPRRGTVSRDTPALFTVETSLLHGVAEPITLQVTELPPGLSARFNPTVVQPGGTSVLTLTTTTATAGFLEAFNVIGTSTSATHVALLNVEIIKETNDFSIRLAPASVLLPAGSSTPVTVETAVTKGLAETVTLAVSGLPEGVSGTFTPSSVTAGQSATLLLTASPTAPGAVTTLSVTGTSPSATRNANAAITVTGTFSLGLEPSARTMASGTTAVLRVQTERTAGGAEPLVLEVSDLPAWLSGVFEPPQVLAGESSALRLSALNEAPGGERATIMVSGRASSGLRATTMGSITILNDFSLKLLPENQSVLVVEPAIFQINTQVTSGPPEEISLSLSGITVGDMAVMLEPRKVIAGGSAILVLQESLSQGEPVGFTISGVSASTARSVQGQVTFLRRGPGDGEPPPLRRTTYWYEGGGCTATGPFSGLEPLVFWAIRLVLGSRTKRRKSFGGYEP